MSKWKLISISAFSSLSEPWTAFSPLDLAYFFLIALKLAQFDYYRTKFGNSPIVLLDDIFDKLDQERVRQIVQILEKKDFSQIFITDTHVDRVKDALSDSKNKEEIFDLEKLKSYD